MWVSKFGFKWKIGNGRKVEFWGNNWLDPNLTIQHWDLYTVVNEKKQVINLVGLKCTFRRMVDARLWRSVGVQV
jgi:hypothetical protein